jgi:hypothetical protein
MKFNNVLIIIPGYIDYILIYGEKPLCILLVLVIHLIPTITSLIQIVLSNSRTTFQQRLKMCSLILLNITLSIQRKWRWRREHRYQRG